MTTADGRLGAQERAILAHFASLARVVGVRLHAEVGPQNSCPVDDHAEERSPSSSRGLPRERIETSISERIVRGPPIPLALVAVRIEIGVSGE